MNARIYTWGIYTGNTCAEVVDKKRFSGKLHAEVVKKKIFSGKLHAEVVGACMKEREQPNKQSTL
jgi:hypothetical protein